MDRCSALLDGTGLPKEKRKPVACQQLQIKHVRALFMFLATLIKKSADEVEYTLFTPYKAGIGT